eukprot:4979072-Prymnesium_polylepis.3
MGKHATRSMIRRTARPARFSAEGGPFVVARSCESSRTFGEAIMAAPQPGISSPTISMIATISTAKSIGSHPMLRRRGLNAMRTGKKTITVASASNRRQSQQMRRRCCTAS